MDISFKMRDFGIHRKPGFISVRFMAVNNDKCLNLLIYLKEFRNFMNCSSYFHHWVNFNFSTEELADLIEKLDSQDEKKNENEICC